MLISILEPNFEHMDERGGLIQLVREGYRQVNYVYSKGGSVRGGHYHKLNTELFYIIRGRLELQLERNDEKEVYTFADRDMFLIPPEVKHTFKYLEDTELISMYDRGVEIGEEEKDIFR